MKFFLETLLIKHFGGEDASLKTKPNQQNCLFLLQSKHLNQTETDKTRGNKNFKDVFSKLLFFCLQNY
jgi:hypothetical protein